MDLKNLIENLQSASTKGKYECLEKIQSMSLEISAINNSISQEISNHKNSLLFVSLHTQATIQKIEKLLLSLKWLVKNLGSIVPNQGILANIEITKNAIMEALLNNNPKLKDQGCECNLIPNVEDRLAMVIKRLSKLQKPAIFEKQCIEKKSIQAPFINLVQVEFPMSKIASIYSLSKQISREAQRNSEYYKTKIRQIAEENSELKKKIIELCRKPPGPNITFSQCRPSAELLVKLEEMGATIHITHLVCPVGTVSSKVAASCITHKWIMGLEWIERSLESGEFLPEHTFGRKFSDDPFQAKTFYFTPMFQKQREGSNSGYDMKFWFNIIERLGDGRIVQNIERCEFVVIGVDEEIKKGEVPSEKTIIDMKALLRMLPIFSPSANSNCKLKRKRDMWIK